MNEYSLAKVQFFYLFVFLLYVFFKVKRGTYSLFCKFHYILTNRLVFIIRQLCHNSFCLCDGPIQLSCLSENICMK